MSKDPAVLFYTSDFISGTELMTFEQKGQYIHLLCIQHQNGHLPEDYMLRILGNLKNPVWLKFEKDDKGLYFNNRMREESVKRKSFCESRKLSRMSQRTSLHTSERTENENEDDNRIPPTIQQVRLYCIERKNSVDAQKWHDFYSAKDWMIGKNKMKNWKAAVRTWEQKKEEVKIWTKHPKSCSECFGNGYIVAPGSGQKFSCREKYGKESKD